MTQRRGIRRFIFTRGGRVVVEIADRRLPRRVIAHGQRAVDLPALGLHFRSVSSRLRDNTQVVPLLPAQHQRRRAYGNGLRELGGFINILPNAFLEQRQPLCTVHRRQIQLNARLLWQRRRGAAIRRPDGPVESELAVKQPAAVEVVHPARVSGQREAVQVALDVQLHRQRLSGLFIQRRRQLASKILQIPRDVDLVLGTRVIRQVDCHFTLPGDRPLHRRLNRLRQDIHSRWLPVTVQIDGHLIRLFTLCGREVDIHELIKPAGGQRLALQVTVLKAELPAEIFQRALKGFNVQTVVLQTNVAFGGGHLTVQRDIKM